MTLLPSVVPVGYDKIGARRALPHVIDITTLAVEVIE